MLNVNACLGQEKVWHVAMIFVEFQLENPIFRETARRLPAVKIEWERNIPMGDSAELLVWIEGADAEAIDSAMAQDPTIERVVRSMEVTDRWLYQVELAEAGSDADLYPILLETGSVVKNAVVTEAGWDCHFGFADNGALSRFFDTCREQDIGFEVERIYEPRPEDEAGSVVTGPQREALEAALEVGYFDVPRRDDLQAVGRRLGISDTAASERIRRGAKTLIRRELR